MLRMSNKHEHRELQSTLVLLRLPGAALFVSAAPVGALLHPCKALRIILKIRFAHFMLSTEVLHRFYFLLGGKLFIAKMQ